MYPILDTDIKIKELPNFVKLELYFAIKPRSSKRTFELFQVKLPPASWSSGNAFISGAEDPRFKSRVGQIGYTESPTAATFLRKKQCCPSKMTRKWATKTGYTLRRSTASIMKDMIKSNCRSESHSHWRLHSLSINAGSQGKKL